MITKELLDFIQQSLTSGKSESEIRQSLISSGGWQESDVNEAFNSLTPQTAQKITTTSGLPGKVKGATLISIVEVILLTVVIIGFVLGNKTGSTSNMQEIIFLASIVALIPGIIVSIIGIKDGIKGIRNKLRGGISILALSCLLLVVSIIYILNITGQVSWIFSLQGFSTTQQTNEISSSSFNEKTETEEFNIFSQEDANFVYSEERNEIQQGNNNQITVQESNIKPYQVRFIEPADNTKVKLGSAIQLKLQAGESIKEIGLDFIPSQSVAPVILPVVSGYANYTFTAPDNTLLPVSIFAEGRSGDPSADLERQSEITDLQEVEDMILRLELYTEKPIQTFVLGSESYEMNFLWVGEEMIAPEFFAGFEGYGLLQVPASQIDFKVDVPGIVKVNQGKVNLTKFEGIKSGETKITATHMGLTKDIYFAVKER